MDVIHKLIRDVTSPIMVRDVICPVEGKSDFSWSSYWETLLTEDTLNFLLTEDKLIYLQYNE